MEEGPPVASRVSTRWPPLAPKKESGCKRLSKKEVSPVSVRRRARKNMATPASKATPVPPAARAMGLMDSKKPGPSLLDSAGAGGAKLGREAAAITGEAAGVTKAPEAAEATNGVGAGVGAGAEAAADAGIDAASITAGAEATGLGIEAAGLLNAGTAEAAASTGAEATPMGVGLASLDLAGTLAATEAGAAGAGTDAGLCAAWRTCWRNCCNSAMFLLSSATRVRLSCCARSWAMRSATVGADAPAASEPLLKVSRSGALLGALARSCTSASTLPCTRVWLSLGTDGLTVDARCWR